MSAATLESGFYTVSEAARLLGVGSQRILAWFRGNPRPIRDFEPVDGQEELSFLDLVELRNVVLLRDAGARLSALREAASRFARDLETDHPFASRRVLTHLDTARTLASGASEDVLRTCIDASILPALAFDERTLLARSWRPLPARFPLIAIDPRRAFGQPVVERGVPTGVLSRAWQSEDEDAVKVADWYGVSVEDVMDAVAFEQALDAPVRREAA